MVQSVPAKKGLSEYSVAAWCIRLDSGSCVGLDNASKGLCVDYRIFLLVALLSARRCWRYIKMPYHCAPIFKKMLTRQQFEELLGNEEFDIVQLQNKRYQKGGPMLVSQNWAVLEGFLLCRIYIKKVHYVATLRTTMLLVTYHNEQHFSLPLPAFFGRNPDKELVDALEQIMKVKISVVR